jgi:hypothetical protein
MNEKECNLESLLGVTDSDGTLLSVVYTINGSLDAILVKSGYVPRHVHGVASSPAGGRIDFGEVLMDLGTGEESR